MRIEKFLITAWLYLEANCVERGHFNAPFDAIGGTSFIQLLPLQRYGLKLSLNDDIPPARRTNTFDRKASAGPGVLLMKPLGSIVVSVPKMAASGGQQNLDLQSVTSYRLYSLDGVRKVASGEWIDADDDLEAIEVAKKKFRDGYCEVWQGPRLVARLECNGD